MQLREPIQSLPREIAFAADLCDFSIRAPDDNSKKFMRFSAPRWLAAAMIALAPAGVCAQALGLKLKLQRTWVGPPASSAEVPTFIFADRLEGTSGNEASAEGSAELRKANTSVEADSMKYFQETEEVEATGHVRIERAGDVITGPSLKYRMNDSTGAFQQPEFTLLRPAKTGTPGVEAHGNASVVEFLGEDRFKVRDVFFTTCKPEQADWYIQGRELDIDYTREVGTVHGGKVVFKGMTIIPAPYLDFSLNNARKSGFLPPHVGTTGKSGAEFATPYYFNLAPNYDATLTPRYMMKRGLQLGSEVRYLEPNYSGEYRGEVLPNDQARNETRAAQTLVHSYRNGPVAAGLNLNKVSDDFYFVDLASRINITSQVNLLRDGFVSYSGGWAGTGSYGITGRVQSYQTLQTDPNNPVPIPYARRPQITLGATRQDLGAGFDFGMGGEYVNFAHPSNVIGSRATMYPAFTLPLIRPAAYITPKLGLNVTQYELERQDPSTPASINRTLPIASVDSGLIFERDAQWRGQSFVQTLEPRAYYVYIPFRDQNRIPLFDTGLADLNYAQIFSENSFAGGDRINDANQITLGLTSRMLLASTGQEAIRATIAQRYYFEDQRVTLNPTDTPRTSHSSDYLAAVSGRVAANWTVEVAEQYNPRDARTERVTVATRYQPGPLQTLNLSYRYLRDQIAQVDVSSQWPLGGGWYGVGRFNYSTSDKRIVEALAGIEYNAGCWISRVVVQHFALTAGTSTSALFLQLELNGFSRIGSNPLEALKRNVPGYQRLDSPTPDQPARPFD
jgi:LPS-assembly protein